MDAYQKRFKVNITMIKPTKKKKHSAEGSSLSTAPLVIALILGLFVIYTHTSILHHGSTMLHAMHVDLAHPTARSEEAHATPADVTVDKSVLDLIKTQNDTIVALRERLEAHRKALLRATSGVFVQEGREESHAGNNASLADQLAHALAELESKKSEIDSLRRLHVEKVAGAGRVDGATQDVNIELLPRILRSKFDEECGASRIVLSLSRDALAPFTRALRAFGVGA